MAFRAPWAAASKPREHAQVLVDIIDSGRQTLRQRAMRRASTTDRYPTSSPSNRIYTTWSARRLQGDGTPSLNRFNGRGHGRIFQAIGWCPIQLRRYAAQRTAAAEQPICRCISSKLSDHRKDGEGRRLVKTSLKFH